MKAKYINELIKEGRITFSEEAKEEFDKEVEETDEKVDESTEETNDETKDESNESLDDLPFGDDGWDDAFNEVSDEEVDDLSQPTDFDAMSEEDPFLSDDIEQELWDDQPTEEIGELDLDDKNIIKVQTVDVLSKIIGRYDEYVNKVDAVTWQQIMDMSTVTKKRRTPGVVSYWDYVENMYNLANKIFAGHNVFSYLDIYNTLYDKIKSPKWQKGLAVYARSNFGRPFVSEGIYLLMYELSVEWAVFTIKYLTESPELDFSNFEEDSFVKKMPNFTLLTYIAKLIGESDEFNEFMTSTKAYELLTDEGNFHISLDQIEKKQTMVSSLGESLMYYSNLVKEDYADILAGALDKLGTVLYLHNNCRLNFTDRLSIINELVRVMLNKRPIESQPDNTTLYSNTNNDLIGLQKRADELIIARQEARLIMDSDKSNYILKIVNEI